MRPIDKYIHRALRHGICIQNKICRLHRQADAVILQDQAVIKPFSGLLLSGHLIYILPQAAYFFK